ncbi:hypothetical protein ACVIKO_000044 [Rhizobium ruizarguesonis]
MIVLHSKENQTLSLLSADDELPLLQSDERFDRENFT